VERYLALDYGEKRIGVAMSDPLNITAQAHPYIENNNQTINSIKKIVSEYEVAKIVLGLPKDREGNDSKKAIEVREFGKKIEDELNCEVTYWDERFSTVAVNKHLISLDVSRKRRKQIVDSQAAAFFLQGFMDRQANK
jgi:putative holliday junction resolvase